METAKTESGVQDSDFTTQKMNLSANWLYHIETPGGIATPTPAENMAKNIKSL